MGIKIIKATVNEAAAIAVVGRQSFYDAFHSIFINKDELNVYLDKTYSVKKLEQSITNPGNLFYVAYKDDKAVGFAKIKKQSAHPQIAGGHQSELQKIYVLKEYHGSGVAQTMLNTVTDAVRNETISLWLNVHVSNQRAKRFYEKNGFAVAGKHYYTIGTQKFEFDLMMLTVGHPTHELKKNGELAGVAHR